MGKGFNYLYKYTMQVSKDIFWGITRRNNAFLYKDRFTSLSSDPFNATNRHSASNAGFTADGNRVGLTANGKGKLNMVVKHKRRTVNSAPKLNRTGAESGKKSRKNNRSFNFSQGTINDKNAMNAFACPMLKRRITKLHRANCRAAAKKD